MPLRKKISFIQREREREEKKEKIIIYLSDKLK